MIKNIKNRTVFGRPPIVGTFFWLSAHVSAKCSTFRHLQLVFFSWFVVLLFWFVYWFVLLCLLCVVCLCVMYCQLYVFVLLYFLLLLLFVYMLLDISSWENIQLKFVQNPILALNKKRQLSPGSHTRRAKSMLNKLKKQRVLVYGKRAKQNKKTVLVYGGRAKK